MVARLQKSEPQAAMQAWDDLCRTYRRPVMEYVRRHHPRPDEVEDLTQEFFCRLVQRELLRGVDAEKGRLRAWLLVLLKRFLINAQVHGQAQKRGGHLEKVSLDGDAPPPGVAASPEEWDVVFDRQWAFALIERVFSRLREEHSKPAQLRTLDALRPLLLQPASGALQQAADRLGMTNGAAKVALHRLRQRFGTVLRDEVSATVGSDDDTEDELRHLLKVISMA